MLENPSDKMWPGIGGPNVDYITLPPGRCPQKRWPRNLCVLGSTGSIGVNALKEAAAGNFRIRSLAAGKNITLLAEQAEIFQPALLAVAEEEDAALLGHALKGKCGARILFGSQGYRELARDGEADCVVCAQMGSAGLDGAIEAALAGKMIALANKESLVLAGGLLRKLCRHSGASILPVDSEHFALFQCSVGRGQTPLEFILTASGGPFRSMEARQFTTVTPEMALRHPNWSMGKKITIDSATLMNKGFEYIEARHLFGVDAKALSILVHPQSIIHSLVRFRDNGVLGQLGQPDMRLPIAACLSWPFEAKSSIAPLDLAAIGSLTFERPDADKFPCLKLAIEASDWPSEGAWQILGLNPAAIVLSAANDFAAQAFLEGKCSFPAIWELAAAALAKLVYNEPPCAAFNGDDSHLEIARQGLANIRNLEAATRTFVKDKLA